MTSDLDEHPQHSTDQSPHQPADHHVDRRAMLRGLGGAGALAATLGLAGRSSAQDAGSGTAQADATDAGQAPDALIVPSAQRADLTDPSAGAGPATGRTARPSESRSVTDRMDAPECDG